MKIEKIIEHSKALDEFHKQYAEEFKKALGNRKYEDLTEEDYDFEGRLIPQISVRTIIKSLGFIYNEENNTWSIKDDDKVLNSYPMILQDDGMGYGANSGIVTSVEKDKDNNVQIWF